MTIRPIPLDRFIHRLVLGQELVGLTKPDVAALIDHLDNDNRWHLEHDAGCPEEPTEN